jgi:hypothetical protein
MRYIELPDSIVKDIRRFAVMRDKPDTKLGEISELYDGLIKTVTEQAEDIAFNNWLDFETDEVGMNPIDLHNSSISLAQETIEVYVQKIKIDAARNLLKAIFNPTEDEEADDFMDDMENDNEE